MTKIIFLGTCSGTEPMPDMYHSAFLVEKNNCYYWFDAGESCSRNAHLMGIDLLKVHSVFISHPHIDHVGGLANLIWNIRKLKLRSNNPTAASQIRVFLPNMKTWEGIMTILKEAEKNILSNYEIMSSQIFDGLIFENQDIKITAYHNHHLEKSIDSTWQSFSFCIEIDNKRIIYSGDIRDEHDLDLVINNGCDVLIVETGHHKVKNICEYAATKNVGKLLFTHHGREIINNRSQVESILANMPLETHICRDGFVIKI